MKMHTRVQRALFSACVFLMVFCLGCAKPRDVSFDVPSSVPLRVNTKVVDNSMRVVEEEISSVRLFFAFDKYDLKPEAVQALARVAELLKQYPSAKIRINGHCDERGSSEYNYVLGERRARAAYGALLDMGVSASQMEMVTYGKEAPAVSGKNEAAYTRNRRDEFIVLTTCQ